jgi:hypothetical protein
MTQPMRKLSTANRHKFTLVVIVLALVIAASVSATVLRNRGSEGTGSASTTSSSSQAPQSSTSILSPRHLNLGGSDNGRTIVVGSGSILDITLNTYTWNFQLHPDNNVLLFQGPQGDVTGQAPSCDKNGVCTVCPAEALCGKSVARLLANQRGITEIVAKRTNCGEAECVAINDRWTVSIAVR